MGKTLVLAEKPSVGRELARVLGCNSKGAGCYIGSRYIVTWALGHLVTLADPEHYGVEYKSWRLDYLPMLPKKMELSVIKDTSKQYSIVKNLLRQNDVTELVIATDAGREGELVARWIIAKVGFKKPLKRLWISSQTDKAIKDGFARLADGKAYDNLYAAAQCRAEADWLVGLNVTRALTCKHNAQLSAGRVQTPTLAMIVAREDEIRRFVPKEFYTIAADLNGFYAIWRDLAGQSRIFDKLKAEELRKKVLNASFTVTDIKKERKKESPPLLYDLTELQRDANKKYGLSAKKTLSLMQQLYEVHKLLTYPRTDSRYITTDIVPTLTERLKSIAVGGYAPTAREILKNNSTIAKKCVDNNKVSDHHAIIPTEQTVFLNSLSVDEKNIYDLVVKRFLSVFCSDYIYDRLTVHFRALDEAFDSKGKTIIELGWKKVYLKDTDDSDDADEQKLPGLNKGEVLKPRDIKLRTDRTKPPARYTEATLLSAMEHPGKFIADDSMREIMDKTSGLGTPATRAEIIERLLSAFYIERKGKELVPTSKGIQLINIVPPDLKEPELTAKWEQQLNLISKGSQKSSDFMLNIRAYASDVVKKVIASNATYKHDNITCTPCPMCEKLLLEVNGKKGKMLVCVDRECGYRKSLSMLTRVRCPNCHKSMEVIGEGENRKYICPCGFREKFERFNKQLDEAHNSSSKRDIEQYMKKQTEEQKNSPQKTALELAFEAANKKDKE